MDAYGGAEICELVGRFMLSSLPNKFKKENIGLYRDDKLAIFKTISGPQSNKIKKEFQKMFKEHPLEIVVKCNMKVVNYLDITLDLYNGTFKPYHKPGNDDQLH